MEKLASEPGLPRTIFYGLESLLGNYCPTSPGPALKVRFNYNLRVGVKKTINGGGSTPVRKLKSKNQGFSFKCLTGRRLI